MPELTLAASDTAAHAAGAPSRWVQRWSHLVPQGASVLDVACGSGRHVRWFAGRGCDVTGIDRDAAAVEPLAGIGEIVVADIEAGPWPWADRRFDAVIVTNYLWRARLPDIVGSVADGGVLIYETFAIGNETIGKPSNPKFLLRPGELLDAVPGLRVVAFEDGFEHGSEAAPPRFVQRIVAARNAAASATPPRNPLTASSPDAAQLNSEDSEDRS